MAPPLISKSGTAKKETSNSLTTMLHNTIFGWRAKLIFITTRSSGVEPQKVRCLLGNAVPPGGCDDTDGAADTR
jgi:hypothetical protein